jgi:hypothetical protein
MSNLRDLISQLNINAKLDRVLANQEKIMSALTDLQAAVTQLSTDVAAEIAALAAAQANGDDAAVEASVANLKALSAQLQSSIATKTGPTP